MSHTPGPWKAIGPYVNGYVSTGYLIATDYNVREPEPEVGMLDGCEPLHGAMTGFNEDDARLIAAAPELLAACEEMLRTLTCPSRQLLDSTRRELDPWLPQIRAAIAKATQPTNHGDRT